MRIIEKIKKLTEKGDVFFSFEYFPPKTDEGIINLYQRLDKMSQMNPLFIDVTWGAGGSTSDKTLEICKNAQKYYGLETMMHLTCTNMPVETINNALTLAKENGIQNILCLRGDPPRGEEWKKIEGGFGYAVDLIKYIRSNWGDYFGIAVAGYPEIHPDSANQDEDIRFLKMKIDAGADFIITQMFFDCDKFLDFVKKCRLAGINVPIIPGIMPIHTYAGFNRMTTLSKTFVPPEITSSLDPIKENDEAVKNYGINLAIEMCKKLLSSDIKGLHFYTLNLENSVTRIVEGLSLNQKVLRSLPWRPSADFNRKKEDVRPIFWSNRPRSYINRTDSWDDYPNGRWSDSRSPAYGDLTDYHIGGLHMPSFNDRKKLWGENPETISDIANIFVNYCKGEVPSLPWNDTPLFKETSVIKDHIVMLNANNIFTINSQPSVNGEPSDHPIHGWGSSMGFCYQKAYVEFFLSPERFNDLLLKLNDPKYSMITYHAINYKGDKCFTNTSGTNALTWGVFPGCEVKQPTVVDSESFIAWKDEAFQLWNLWAEIYDKNSVSHTIISNIVNSWYLVNIVDNNYVNPNVWSLFAEFISNDNLSS